MAPRHSVTGGCAERWGVKCNCIHHRYSPCCCCAACCFCVLTPLRCCGELPGLRYVPLFGRQQYSYNEEQQQLMASHGQAPISFEEQVEAVGKLILEGKVRSKHGGSWKLLLETAEYSSCMCCHSAWLHTGDIRYTVPPCCSSDTLVGCGACRAILLWHSTRFFCKKVHAVVTRVLP